MDTKTPIVLLQEYLVKEGFTPQYKLVYSGTGTHDTLFQWEVTAKGRSAIGRGKSKKEAKHDAAKQLLLQLKAKRKWRDEVPDVSPYANVRKENAVGALQEMCTQRSLALPQYQIIRDAPHNKIFRVRCTVLSLSTEAEAHTKKQAKHHASQQMLLKLQNYLRDQKVKLSSDGPKKIETLTVYACDATRKAFELVCHKRAMNNDNKLSSRSVGADYFNLSDYFLQNILPLSETLRILAKHDGQFLRNHQNPEDLFKIIMSQLDYDYKLSYLKSKNSEYSLCNLNIRQLNDANFIGVDLSPIVAKQTVFIKALEFMVIMSKV